jgi:hypothetical protein
LINETVSTVQGSRLEMRDLIQGYRSWWAAEGLKAVDLSKRWMSSGSFVSKSALPLRWATLSGSVSARSLSREPII